VPKRESGGCPIQAPEARALAALPNELIWWWWRWKCRRRRCVVGRCAGGGPLRWSGGGGEGLVDRGNPRLASSQPLSWLTTWFQAVISSRSWGAKKVFAHTFGPAQESKNFPLTCPVAQREKDRIDGLLHASFPERRWRTTLWAVIGLGRPRRTKKPGLRRCHPHRRKKAIAPSWATCHQGRSGRALRSVIVTLGPCTFTKLDCAKQQAPTAIVAHGWSDSPGPQRGNEGALGERPGC